MKKNKTTKKTMTWICSIPCQKKKSGYMEKAAIDLGSF